jgi:hypothetical protein
VNFIKDQFKESTLIRAKKFVKRNFQRIINPKLFGKRVFCISIQRTGTTSVGDFLSDHGYRVARWGDYNFYKWPYLHVIGDYESIFKSNAFKAYNAFEDAPWFYRDFHRILFHRFPKSKFILLYRDSNKWFDSMVRHSDGKVLGNTYRHCRQYQRLNEFYDRLDNNPNFKPTENELDKLMSLEGKREHYVQIYESYNRDVKEFFEKYDKSRLYIGRLEDPNKWNKIGEFLGVDVAQDYKIHSNQS